MRFVRTGKERRSCHVSRDEQEHRDLRGRCREDRAARRIPRVHKVIDTLGIAGMPNTNYLKAAKRVVGMISASEKAYEFPLNQDIS